MSAVPALRVARAAGIEFGLDGDDLLLQAAAPPPASILDLLSANKPAIVALLRQSDSSRTAIDERAAIIADNVGLPRAWAEGYTRLCVMPPPAGIPERDWQAMVDGAGRLLEQWGGKLASSRTSSASTGSRPLPGSTWPAWFGSSSGSSSSSSPMSMRS
jgi:hypothetical protein